MRRRGAIRSALAAASASALALAAAPEAGAQYGEGRAAPNPCIGELAEALRCPDLKMAPPAKLFLKRSHLHAENNIQSRGEGPLEIRGRRTGRRKMEAYQRIHQAGGGRMTFEIPAQLRFYNVPRGPGKGRFWKFHQAASFELWTIGAEGEPAERVRTGPKLNYCFRDLKRTNPSGDSPRHRVYPGCSQNPGRKRVTLGTSVGWSDIYPAGYYENWINVRGLNGCFLFIHRVDPVNVLFENDETNNTGQRRVKLGGGKVRSC